MGLKKINNQFKIKCLECGLTMDNAYQMKHNDFLPCWNAETTQNGQVAKYQHSKESFRRSATSSGKETPHRWSICVYVTCCQCKLYCWQILYDQYYCYNNWSFQMQFYQNRKIIFCMYWKTWKAKFNNSKTPLSQDMPYKPKDPKCFLEHGNKSQPFQPSWFNHENCKTWLTYNPEKDAVFCFTCIKTCWTEFDINQKRRKSIRICWI